VILSLTEVYAGLGELCCERTATECDTLIALLTCVCLIILMVPVAPEIIRCTMKIFAKDKPRWQEHDEYETHAFAYESSAVELLCTLYSRKKCGGN
jgi:hypothetical protein